MTSALHRPAMLSHADAERLVKLLGMLGSAHAGERAAAAAKAAELVRDAGVTWDAIISRTVEEFAAPQEPTWRQLVRFCQQHADQLSNRDRDFIDRLAGYRSLPSDHQLLWLHDIVERIERATFDAMTTTLKQRKANAQPSNG